MVIIYKLCQTPATKLPHPRYQDHEDFYPRIIDETSITLCFWQTTFLTLEAPIRSRGHTRKPLSLPHEDDCRKDPHAGALGMLKRRKVPVCATSLYFSADQAQIAVDVFQFLEKGFREGWDPTIEDHYRKETTINGKPHAINILDTAGAECFFPQQDGWIRQGDGFLLIYDVTCRPSFEEIRKFAYKVKNSKKHTNVGQHEYPVMIIGNKNDLSDERKVSTLEGQDIAKELGYGFLEVSAMSGKYVNEEFEDVASALCAEPTPCTSKVTKEKLDRVVVPREERRRRVRFFRWCEESVSCMGFKRRQT